MTSLAWSPVEGFPYKFLKTTKGDKNVSYTTSPAFPGRWSGEQKIKSLSETHSPDDGIQQGREEEGSGFLGKI